MTSGSTYRMLHIDLLPLLQEAFDQTARDTSMDFDYFCEVVYRTIDGPSLQSREWDSLDRAKIEDAAWLVRRWAHSLIRIPQVSDPDIRLLRPYLFLEVGDQCCEAVKHLCDRWLEPDELHRLPLPDCDYRRCLCQYRTWSRRDLEKYGLQRRGGA